MPEFSLVALKDEIVGDPKFVGYKNSSAPTDWKGDEVIASLINAKGLTVTRSEVGPEEIKEAIAKTPYVTLAPSEEGWLNWITDSGTVIVTPDLKASLYDDNDSIFSGAPGAATRAALKAVVEIPGSRAEELWVVGLLISEGQVGLASNEVV